MNGGQMLKVVALGTLILSSAAVFSANAADLSLSPTPLFVTNNVVEPNVMLLIDNSGSMDNVIWASGYNNSTTYPNWSNGYWSSDDGNVFISEVPRGGCSSGWKQGKKSGVTKCLKLPDPVGSSYTRYSGNYLNYLFETYATGTDLTTGQIPTDYRMKVARNVSGNIVTNTSGMRFGVSRFYGPSGYSYGHGATVDANCGTSASTIVSKINTYTSATNTPLAEAYYEVTRYFRGLSSYYHSSTNYTSPIQYRCQKNFVIVVTDGFPTRDSTFPTDDPADVADSDHSLPNWDNETPATSSGDYPNFPVHSDGFGGSDAYEASTLYLDDLAKFGHDIDLKTSGTDSGGMGYQASDYPQQNLVTYTVGFSIANQMLEDAASPTYGDGKYFTANNADQLTNALSGSISDIQGRVSSAAAVALNSSSVREGSLVYQARFNSADWSGELRYIPIDTSGNLSAPTVETSTVLDSKTAATRVILTYRPDTPKGVKFAVPAVYGNPGSGEFSAAQINALLTNAPFPATTTTPSEITANQTYLANLVSYLRGDAANEVQNGGSFRNRASKAGDIKLGDIINSAPVFVGAPAFNYTFSGYNTFRTDNKTRTTLVYVGANDGMLHGFNAQTGEELPAYIPNTVYKNLYRLSETNYKDNHRYFVDGSPSAGDAVISGNWRTVLVGGLQGGGQALFALDVTNPANFTEANADQIALWEFTDASTDGGDLGYTFSRPTIVRMNDGSWGAIVGNGYNSTENDGHVGSGNAVLYILNIENGAVLKKIDTGVGPSKDPKGLGRPNGLATPAVVDVDGDSIADFVYAGDLFGNVWRFDVASTDRNNWKVGHVDAGGNPIPMFTAKNASGVAQPITTRPIVGLHPAAYEKKGFMIYFGTGKYLETGDNTSASQDTQSAYGVWDSFNANCFSSNIATCTNDGTNYTAPSRSANNLLRQEIVAEVTSGSNLLRVTTDNDNGSIDWNTYRGWLLDLIDPDDDANHGERVVTDMILRNGRLIFTTLIPSEQVCAFGGTGWVMELDTSNGGRLDYTPFDVNNDSTFDQKDYVTVAIDGNTIKVPVSGLNIPDGVPSAPNVAHVGTGVGSAYYEGPSSGGGSGSANVAHDRVLINTSGSAGSGSSPANIVAPRSNYGSRLGRAQWRQLK